MNGISNHIKVITVYNHYLPHIVCIIKLGLNVALKINIGHIATAKRRKTQRHRK